MGTATGMIYINIRMIRMMLSAMIKLRFVNHLDKDHSPNLFPSLIITNYIDLSMLKNEY